MADAPIAVAGVTVVGAPAVDAAHEPHKGVRAPQRRHSGMASPPFGADGLDAIEEGRLDGRRETSGALLLVGAALVADRPPGVQRIGEDLGQSGLGETELVSKRRIAPRSRPVQLEGTAHSLEVRTLHRFEELALPHPREPKRRMAARIVEEAPLLRIAPRHVAREPSDVRGVRDGLQALEFVGLDVARDEPIGAEDDRDTGCREAAAVRVCVLDVACETGGVVAEKHLEGPRLGVSKHSGEVGAPQGVLARHEIDVLEIRG